MHVITMDVSHTVSAAWV